MNSTNKQNLLLGIVAVAIMAGIGWVSLRGTNEKTDNSVVGLSADVLSPSLFDDEKTRAAYHPFSKPLFAAAWSFGHKNNLSAKRSTWLRLHDSDIAPDAANARRGHAYREDPDSISQVRSISTVKIALTRGPSATSIREGPCRSPDPCLPLNNTMWAPQIAALSGRCAGSHPTFAGWRISVPSPGQWRNGR